MIYDIPLLRSLDPHHARIGYLGALAAVGVRTLDTYDALLARFRDLLFERYYPDEPRFSKALEDVEPALRPELEKRMIREHEEDPAAILAPLDQRAGWLTRSECWLYSKSMPSHVGYLLPKHSGRTVDLAKWTGVLLPTLDLSETGVVLQYLVTRAGESRDSEANLLCAGHRPALTLMYLRLVTAAEILFPVLISVLDERVRLSLPLATRGPNGLLRAAVERLIGVLGEPTEPEDVHAFRELREFQEAILSSKSTEENYLRPRLEILVDLGLVVRRIGSSREKPGAFPWEISEGGRLLAIAWRHLAMAPRKVDEFLEGNFAGSTAPALGLNLREVHSQDETLFWFSVAYGELQRDIGFTPGRPLAVLASLLAAENGVRLEIGEIYDAVYDIPAGPYSEHVGFSGGSRFDREFMITLKPTMLHNLRQQLRGVVSLANLVSGWPTPNGPQRDLGRGGKA